MRKPYYLAVTRFIFLSLVIVSLKASGQDQRVLTKASAEKWYGAKEWLNGLKLSPHESTDKQELARQYHAHEKWWNEAFAFLKRSDLSNLEPGKYIIDSENVYATITVGSTHDLAKTRWESHRNYQDIHYVIKGKEKIGLAPISSATVIKEYDSTKDIAFYEAEGKYYVSNPATFFIIFPQQAHRPGIKIEGDDKIRKVVIKIRRTR